MPERRRSELVYDAVACGMWLYVHAAFRVVLLGGENLRAMHHRLFVATHRSDADVPLICAEIYFGDRMWLRRSPRLHFAARDDLLEPGVVAGLLPATIPGLFRRLLFRLDAGPYLPRMRVNPVRSATAMKAVQILRLSDPATPLQDALPAALVAELGRRGLPPSTPSAEAVRAELAHVLWTEVDKEQLPDEMELWQRRAQEAAADVRRLVELLRAGKPLLLFPEGRPSPDGAVGPLRRGLDLLLRRGAPHEIVPLGISFDPLTEGRPRACLVAGAPFAPPEGGERAVLGELRRAMPLTCGPLVSFELLRAAEEGRVSVPPAQLDAALASAVEAARAERRHIDPPLRAEPARRARLGDCLRALSRRGVIDVASERRFVLDPGRLRGDQAVRRGAVEYESTQLAA